MKADLDFIMSIADVWFRNLWYLVILVENRACSLDLRSYIRIICIAYFV